MKLVDRSLLEDLGLTVGHFEVLSWYHVPVHKNQHKIPNNIQQLNKVRKERQYNGESLSVPVHQNHPALGSCSNVQTHGMETVEIKLIEQPEPSPNQTVEVAMEPDVSEMIAPSQRDDSAIRELRPAISHGPQQPVLREYNPQNFGNEIFIEDFLPKWFKQYVELLST